MDAPEWISVSEAAQLSGYSVKIVRSVIRQGKVKAEKTSGIQEWRVDKQSLRDYLWHVNSLGTEKPDPHSYGDWSASSNDGLATWRRRPSSPLGLNDRGVFVPFKQDMKLPGLHQRDFKR